MTEDRRLFNRVKQLRTRLRLSQSDLAREVGITRQSVISIEKGKLNPSIVVCLKIARVLREPVDYVFYLETPIEKAAPADRAAEVCDDYDDGIDQSPFDGEFVPPQGDENRGIWDFV